MSSEIPYMPRTVIVKDDEVYLTANNLILQFRLNPVKLWRTIRHYFTGDITMAGLKWIVWIFLLYFLFVLFNFLVGINIYEQEGGKLIAYLATFFALRGYYISIKRELENYPISCFSMWDMEGNPVIYIERFSSGSEHYNDQTFICVKKDDKVYQIGFEKEIVYDKDKILYKLYSESPEKIKHMEYNYNPKFNSEKKYWCHYLFPSFSESEHIKVTNEMLHKSMLTYKTSYIDYFKK